MKKQEQSLVGKAYLTTKSIHPENQETPIQFIEEEYVSPRLFYKRNHFHFPDFISSFYWLPINGETQTSRSFSLSEISALPHRTISTVMECAGNKRELFKPKVFGEQWGKGAMSQGIWRGVSLSTLFAYTGLRETAKEVVFEAYDRGERTDTKQISPFARSLPLEKALHPDTIIAYEYNGHPIPFKHGYPLRLIVPGWYGMASVKWIKKITVIKEEFKGPFQSIDYVYYPNKENKKGNLPVTEININSTIQKPLDREILKLGTHIVHGIAWSGKESVTRVEVSLDGGESWEVCKLSNTKPYVWTRWSYLWDAKEHGEYTIMSRATNSKGQSQPQVPFWNQKGYGYNAVDKIKVKVE